VEEKVYLCELEVKMIEKEGSLCGITRAREIIVANWDCQKVGCDVIMVGCEGSLHCK
jgi:hypothetical protein